MSAHSPCTWTVRSLPQRGSTQLEAISGGLVLTDGARALVSSDHGATFGLPPWLASDVAPESEAPRFLTSNGRTLFLATPSTVLAVDVDHVRRLPGPENGLPGGGSFVLAAFKASSTGLYALVNREDVTATADEDTAGKGHYSGHLYRSTDDGATWAEEVRLSSLDRGPFNELLISGPSRRWVRDATNRWLSTVDDGANWALLPQLPVDGWMAAGPRSLLLRTTHGAGENALLRSSDAGSTWHPVDGGPTLDQLVAASGGDWSATKGSHFLRSLDDGRHWQEESDIYARDRLASECLSAGIVSWIGLWRSDDEGYALGLVNPDLNIDHPTSVTSRDTRLLAHRTCSPTPSGSVRAP